MKEIKAQYFEDEFEPGQSNLDIVNLEEKDREEIPVIREDEIPE